MNIYLPDLATIEDIKEETPDIKSFKFVFQDKDLRDSFEHKAGQFVLISSFGVGEATFCIASPAYRNEYIECSVKRLGKVTQALHELDVGDVVGIRGPYGNYFPIDTMKGKNLIFIGGGIGLAPLRPLIWDVLHEKSDFKDITIVYGAKSVADLIYKEELEQWKEMAGVRTVLTVDPGGETSDWKAEIGFVPSVLDKLKPDPQNAVAITCGPPIMIKLVLESLEKMNFMPEQILTTLEMKMKCGIGMCGRCNIGPVYVCREGPVFSYQQIKALPAEF